MRTITAFCLFCFHIYLPSVHAKTTEQTPPVVPADIVWIYQLGLENDSKIKASEATFRSTLQQRPLARSALLPRLDAKSTTTRLHSHSVAVPDYPLYQHALIATWPLFHPELWLALKNAELAMQAGLAEYELASADLLLRVATSYFSILKAQDALHFAHAQTTAFTKHLDQTQKRFEVGLIAITDVHEAKARRDLAYARELTERNNLTLQQEKLREITGTPIENLAELRSNLPLTPPQPNDEEAWVTAARAQNPSLRTQFFKAEIARELVAKEAMGHLPTVDLVGQIQKGNSTAQQTHYGNTQVTLTVSAPIFASGNVIARTKAQRATFEAAQYAYDQAWRATESEIRQTFRSVLTQISTIQALKQAVISNKSALKATEAAYQVGTRTIVDVLDAQSNLLSAESDYARARYDYVLYSLKLKFLAGNLSPVDLAYINEEITPVEKKLEPVG